MTIKTVVILPKQNVDPKLVQDEINRYLHQFAANFQAAMSTYPPEQAWKSRTPQSGSRKGGARTGTYGAGWHEVQFSKSSVAITNSVSYAVVVGGSRKQSPGQAHVLAARGWPSVQDVVPEIKKATLPNFSKAFTTFKV